MLHIGCTKPTLWPNPLSCTSNASTTQHYNCTTRTLLVSLAHSRPEGCHLLTCTQQPMHAHACISAPSQQRAAPLASSHKAPTLQVQYTHSLHRAAADTAWVSRHALLLCYNNVYLKDLWSLSIHDKPVTPARSKPVHIMCAAYAALILPLLATKQHCSNND
jgi:hypothetical protein